MLLRINGTPQWENRNNLFCCKVSFLRGPHCQFGGVGKQLNQGFLLVIATEYLCHKWPGICFVCRNHNPVRSPFLTYHRVFNKNNTTGPLLEQTTAYLLDCPGSPQLLGGSCVLCIVDRCLSFFFPPLYCSCSTSGTLRLSLASTRSYFNQIDDHDIRNRSVSSMITLWGTRNAIPRSFCNWKYSKLEHFQNQLSVTDPVNTLLDIVSCRWVCNKSPLPMKLAITILRKYY
jgi:hypothetical protein